MYDIFHVFGEKKGWIYDINPLQADNSHEIPSHIQCLKAVTRFRKCCQLQNFSGVFRANIVFCGTKMEQLTHDKSFHKTEFLILSHIGICS